MLVFKNVFAQRMKDWDERINKSARATTYNAIRSFTFHSYLDTIKLKRIRTYISKIRLSSHRLEIEIGRKCRLCNIFEDEYHFILEYPLYLDLGRFI